MISKNNKKTQNSIELFLLQHSGIILTILLIILMILIIALIVSIADISSAHGVLGTEANQYYYHMEDII